MSEIIQKILELTSQAKFDQAKQIAEKLPNSLEKENVFGMIAYYEGNLDEAIKHFKKALDFDPINSDVLYNYGKALLDTKDYKESWRYLMRIHNKDWTVYDLLGDTQLAQGNIPMALYYYGKAAEISPLEEMKKKYLEHKKEYHKDTNIAILCLPGLDNFIHDIANILGEVYNVKLVVSANGNEIVQAYEWADIVWLEWANELAVEVTNKLEKKGKKIVCRLHSYEALTNAFLPRIDWEKVDNVILVSEHMKEVIRTYHESVYEKVKNKIVIIHNGLNLDRFKYKPRTKGYNLAIVAHINYKKDPTMWLQIMHYLTKIDERYNLSIAGDFQDYRYHFYFNHIIKETGLDKNIKFVGFVSNVDEFLKDKNYILSTSVHEGHPYNIMEAMAMGIKPVIHNYAGAKAQWPQELIFNFIEEIPEILNQEYETEVYRRFVEEKYSLELQILRIGSVALQNNLTHKISSMSEGTHHYMSKPVKNEEYNLIVYSGVLNKRSGGPSGYLGYLEEGLKKTKGHKVHIKTMPSRVTQQYESIESLLKDFGKFVETELFNENYNLIHFHSTLDFYAFLAFAKNKMGNFVTILTSHSPVPPHQETIYYIEEQLKYEAMQNEKGLIWHEENIRRIKSFYENIDIEAYKAADYIVFPCEEAMEEYFKWAPFRSIISKKRLEFVLSGVEPISYELTSEQIRAKYGIPQDAFVVSYIGRHNSFKGYDILQEAAEQVWKMNKDIWFLIAGKEWPMKGLTAERWIEVGWTKDPGSLINASDIFVLPNRATYFDLVLLEVLSMGKPVLASNTGGNKYVARQTEGVILFDVDSRILARKILELAAERDLLHEVGDMNKLTYERYYTVELFAKRYVELYNKIERSI